MFLLNPNEELLQNKYQTDIQSYTPQERLELANMMTTPQSQDAMNTQYQPDTSWLPEPEYLRTYNPDAPPLVSVEEPQGQAPIFDVQSIQDLFSGIDFKTPDRYKDMSSKIGKVKELTKPDAPEKRGYTTGEKVGMIFQGLSDVAKAFDKSRKGKGMTSAPGKLGDYIANLDKKRQADQDAAIKERALGMEIEKYNNQLQNQAYQQQMNMASAMVRQDQFEAEMAQREEIAKRNAIIKLLVAKEKGKGKEGRDYTQEATDKMLAKDYINYQPDYMPQIFGGEMGEEEKFNNLIKKRAMLKAMLGG